jgi:hypothetical protein
MQRDIGARSSYHTLQSPDKIAYLLSALVAVLSRLSPAAVAVRATKGDLAWHLLHDASITVGKEQAVLLPEVRKVSTCCWTPDS